MPIGYWDSEADGGNGCYIVDFECTTLDSGGNGELNGLVYLGGELAQGFQTFVPNTYYSGTFFIDGVPTGLNEYGYGFWNFTYYVAGVPTTLDYCGNGLWDGMNYVEGALAESAWSGCADCWMYFNQCMDSLTSGGDGYQFMFGYFIGGQLTSLDNNGSGYWNNEAYYQGMLQGTGWNGYYYYINHEQTTLDSMGNGTWNDILYLFGTAQVYATIFEGTSDTDWQTLANWTGNSLNDPLPAVFLPSGNDPIYIRGALTNNSGGEPSVPSATVLGTGVVGINLSLNAGNGTITFRDTSQLRDGVTIYGNAVFRDMSKLTSGGATITGNVEFWDDSLAEYDSMTSTVLYSPSGTLFRHRSSLQTYLNGNAEFRDDATMSGNGQVSGTATFKGNSGNGVSCGALSRQHGGGINGSNILGFA